MRKIISECCELVKLCHINGSGPVFLRHTVYRLRDIIQEALDHKLLTFFIRCVWKQK